MVKLLLHFPVMATMALFSGDNGENDLFLSRTDPENPFGTHGAFSFELEGKSWPTVEHYFQGMKFTDQTWQERVRAAATPAQARKLGRKRRKSLRRDWKQVRETVMTRGVYTCFRTHPELAEKLLSTGDQKIVENSNFDYFWGCGRDRRGKNCYGQVLMNVRAKLLQELAS